MTSNRITLKNKNEPKDGDKNYFRMKKEVFEKYLSLVKNAITAMSLFLSKKLAASNESSSSDLSCTSNKSQKRDTLEITELILFSMSDEVRTLSVKFEFSAFALVSAVTKYDTRNVINPIDKITIAEIMHISFTPIEVFFVLP